MATALVLLHPGVEEVEAVTPIDLLRRAGIETTTASVVETKTVTGKMGIPLTADWLLGGWTGGLCDVLVIPGGPGVVPLRGVEAVGALIRDYAEAGKLLAAICAAPLLLHDAGVLTGHDYTAHHSCEAELPRIVNQPVVHSGKILTSRGAGTAVAFSLAIIGELAGSSAAHEVAASIHA